MTPPKCPQEQALELAIEALENMPHPEYCEYWNRCKCTKLALTQIQALLSKDADKPLKPKAREFWIEFMDEGEHIVYSRPMKSIGAIHVHEVLDEPHGASEGKEE